MQEASILFIESHLSSLQVGLAISTKIKSLKIF